MAAAREFADAVEYYKQAIEYDPSLTQAYLGLGNIYMNYQIDYELAVPVWKRLIVLTPDEASIHALLGQSLYQLKRYDEALAALRNATRLKGSPDVLAIVHYNISLIHLKMGQKEKALEVYRKLQTIDKAEAQKLYAKINEGPRSQPVATGGNAASQPASGAGKPSPTTGGGKAAKAAPVIPAKPTQPKAPAGGGAPSKGNSAPPQGGTNKTSPTQSATAPKDAAQELAALQAKAERGDAAAQYKLADYHFSKINDDEGHKWLRKSAEGGNPDAQNSLGFRHLIGRGVPEDVAEGRKWLKKAAEQAHSAALIHLCGSYVEEMNLLKGAVPAGDLPPPPAVGSRQDVTEALNWCGKAANQGHTMSQYNLGLLYAKGSADFRPDYEKAYFWLTVRNAPQAKVFREKVGQQLTPEKRAEIEKKAQEFKSAGKPPPRAP